MSRPKVGSLFSGVGGFDMGLEAAGFEVAWQVENDRDCISVLERHWPTTTRYGDIREVNGATLAPVDVVIGGWPCQDSSVAGKRAGLLGGARSGLFYEYVRIVREMREATGGRSPELIVGENVPGLLSGDRGRDLARVVAAWAHAGALDVGWRVLDARWFGVAQRRRRVFFVVDFGGQRTGQVLFESARGSGDSEACGEAGEGTAGDVEDGAGIVGLPVAAFGGNRTSGPIDVATAVTAHGGPHGRLDFESETFLVANSVAASAGHHGHSSPRGDGSDNQIVDDAQAFNWQAGGGGNDESFRGKSRQYIARAGDYAGALSTTRHDAVAFHLTQDPINGADCPAIGAGNEHGCSTVAVATFDERNVTSAANRTRLEYGSPANTLHAEGLSVITPMAVRRLTPRECERLQGWPDDHTRWRADGREIPDGPRYRMIGNGVVANVAAWIGRRLLATLAPAARGQEDG